MRHLIKVILFCTILNFAASIDYPELAGQMVYSLADPTLPSNENEIIFPAFRLNNFANKVAFKVPIWAKGENDPKERITFGIFGAAIGNQIYTIQLLFLENGDVNKLLEEFHALKEEMHRQSLNIPVHFCPKAVVLDKTVAYLAIGKDATSLLKTLSLSDLIYDDLEGKIVVDYVNPIKVSNQSETKLQQLKQFTLESRISLESIHQSYALYFAHVTTIEKTVKVGHINRVINNAKAIVAVILPGMDSTEYLLSVFHEMKNRNKNRFIRLIERASINGRLAFVLIIEYGNGDFDDGFLYTNTLSILYSELIGKIVNQIQNTLDNGRRFVPIQPFKLTKIVNPRIISWAKFKFASPSMMLRNKEIKIQILTSPVLKGLGRSYNANELEREFDEKRKGPMSPTVFFCPYAKIDDTEIAFLITNP